MSVDPPLMDPMDGEEDGIAIIKDIGGVHVPNGTGISKVVTWENNAMTSLFSILKSHRKSEEHPEKEDLLQWKQVHLQGRSLECRSDCCQRNFIQ